MNDLDFYEMQRNEIVENAKRDSEETPSFLTNPSDYFDYPLRIYSVEYKVDKKLLMAIITQESNWNCYALRYEPTYNWLYKPDEFKKISKVSLTTEINSQKMSWGLGQIMGALARELGHEGSMPELTDGYINIKLMCKHLAHLKKISPKQDDIIAMYNGGKGALEQYEAKYKNQGYVDSVNAHLNKLISK